MIDINETFKIKYIDASSIATYNRCPARYLFSRLIGLRLPEKTTIAPDFGTDMHRAIPLCYDVDNVDAATAAFKSAWKNRTYGEDDPKRNSERARYMLESFRKLHSGGYSPYDILNLDITAPTAEVISDNEIPFLIDIGGDLPAAGRIDCAVRWKSSGEIWSLDYKTASEISGRYFDNFSFAPQTVLYTLALSQLTNERAAGMIIEALRVSKTNTETQMFMIQVFDHEIESFLRLANDTSKNILQNNTNKKWPKKCTGCGPYSMFGFPSRLCSYYHICKSPDWQAGASIYIRTKPFHPFEVK